MKTWQGLPAYGIAISPSMEVFTFTVWLNIRILYISVTNWRSVKDLFCWFGYLFGRFDFGGHSSRSLTFPMSSVEQKNPRDPIQNQDIYILIYKLVIYIFIFHVYEMYGKMLLCVSRRVLVGLEGV